LKIIGNNYSQKDIFIKQLQEQKEHVNLGKFVADHAAAINQGDVQCLFEGVEDELYEVWRVLADSMRYVLPKHILKELCEYTLICPDSFSSDESGPPTRFEEYGIQKKKYYHILYVKVCTFGVHFDLKNFIDMDDKGCDYNNMYIEGPYQTNTDKPYHHILEWDITTCYRDVFTCLIETRMSEFEEMVKEYSNSHDIQFQLK
jgi:hypothetical protein